MVQFQWLCQITRRYSNVCVCDGLVTLINELPHLGYPMSASEECIISHTY